MNKFTAIVMKAKDNVATVTEEIAANTEVKMNVEGNSLTVCTKDDIPFGHKVAIRNIACGEKIIKYGEVIGEATRDILVGEHTHVHNLGGCRGRGDLQG
ncbi:MAG TPA: UxaA family hydrolase [Negativicutes bacterium]|jgi:altronate dehydratase small subunit